MVADVLRFTTCFDRPQLLIQRRSWLNKLKESKMLKPYLGDYLPNKEMKYAKLGENDMVAYNSIRTFKEEGKIIMVHAEKEDGEKLVLPAAAFGHCKNSRSYLEYCYGRSRQNRKKRLLIQVQGGARSDKESDLQVPDTDPEKTLDW